MVTQSTKTRAWSPAAQESSLKSDKVNRLAAGPDQPFADKSVGDVLNEIADPNWVDPKKVLREPKQDLDKDAFFKLMLTQMKNQDPTNPLQSHEMAAQLAQFTSLEQLFNINDALGELKKGQTPMADYQVLNFMGKSIAADSSKIVRTQGDKSHELRFNLGGDAKSAEISIKDADGQVVKTYSLSNLKKGANSFRWNGMNTDDLPMRAGDYYFTVEAKNEAGSKISASTEVKGRITGVNYTSKGPVLLVGDQTIYLQDVKKIEDADLKGQERQAQRASASEEAGPGAPPETFGRGNLGSVAMSSVVKDQVGKVSETK